MQFFVELFHLLRNLGDQGQWEHFIEFVGGAGTVYAVMFAIVFVETGFVIMPFLPGDSLLFALGAIGSALPVDAHGDRVFDYRVAAALLIVAAICGDNLNYWMGRRLGPMIFSKDAPRANLATPPSDRVDYEPVVEKPSLFVRLLNKKHLHRTELFFQKHGGKAVMLARFVAIIRTFTPFVAGMGRMNYARFLMFSVIGAIAWVCTCVGAGVVLGKIPFVRQHFELVVLAIIGVTIIPISIELWKGLKHKREASVVGATTSGAPTV